MRTRSQALTAEIIGGVTAHNAGDNGLEEENSPAYRKAKAYAYRLLGARDYSCHLFAAKLSSKGHSKAIVERILTEFNDYGYLDDARYADSIMRGKGRAYGWHKICFLLESQGIPQSVIAELAHSRSEEQEREIAEGLARNYVAQHSSRASKHSDHSALEQQGKVYRFLLRRGFSPEVAMAISYSSVNERQE